MYELKLLDFFSGIYERVLQWLQPTPKMRFSDLKYNPNIGKWVSVSAIEPVFDPCTPELEEEIVEEEKEPIISNPFEKLLATIPREKTKSPKRFVMKVKSPSDLVSQRRKKRYREVEEPTSRLNNPVDRERVGLVKVEKEKVEEPSRLKNRKEEATKYVEPFTEKPEPSPIKLERIDEQKAPVKEKTLEDYRESPFENYGTLVIRRRLAEPVMWREEVRRAPVERPKEEITLEGEKRVVWVKEPHMAIFDIHDRGKRSMVIK